jgi:hypothetical protein
VAAVTPPHSEAPLRAASDVLPQAGRGKFGRALNPRIGPRVSPSRFKMISIIIPTLNEESGYILSAGRADVKQLRELKL